AVGVILFEMLCGELPFKRDSFPELILAHISDPPPQPRSINPALSAGLEAVILKAMSKRHEDRYQSPEEMAEALQAVEEPPQFPPPPGSRRLSALSGGVKPFDSRQFTALKKPTPAPSTWPDHQPTLVQGAPDSQDQEEMIRFGSQPTQLYT